MPFSIKHRPPLQTPVPSTGHPSGSGRFDGYEQHFRGFAMAVRQAGLNHEELQLFTPFRAQHDFPSLRSEGRWEERLAALGHYRQYRRTGNRRATVLRDHDCILLALYRVAFPKAMAAEINAFLYRANFGNLDFRFYSPSQISECEKRIGLTRKRGSTTAFQALLPVNRRKRWCYWNLPYPFGAGNIRRSDLIDLDESGFEMASADRKIGKSYIGKRARQAGLYSRTEKWTLLLAISGDPNGDRWLDYWTGEGTDALRMIEFVRYVIADIGPGTAQRRRCFTMDNLSSHHNLQMATIIFNAGHRIVFRAPYYPVDGPIEYVFNTIQGTLQINNRLIVDGTTLVEELLNAVADIPNFVAYFINCGFTLN